MTHSSMHTKSEPTHFIWGIFSLLALAAFVILALSKVFSEGVCCADDANNAVAAKNLAIGLGYGTTMSPLPDKFTADLFDFLVTTGPTVVLPAALFIRLFGNTYWAPGLSFVTCWLLVLLTMGWIAWKYSPGPGFGLSVLTFLGLNYALMTLHFELWYALLGEVPAALLLILGVLLFFHSDSRRSGVSAGFLFGLAVLAKLSALVGIGAFVLALAMQHLVEHGRSTSIRWAGFARALAPVGIGLVVPLAMFDAWKYLVLGPAGYAANFRGSLDHILGLGAKSHPATNLLGLYNDGIYSLLGRFHILLPDLVLVFVIVWLIIRPHGQLRRLYVVLVSMIAAYSVWWIFFSIGWPRYYIVALPIIILVISLPFLLPSSNWRLRLLYMLLLLIWSSPSWTSLLSPLSGLRHHFFVATGQTKALLQVRDLLAPVAAAKVPIVTQGWATGMDIEYILDTYHNFTHYKDLASVGDRRYWIAVNTKWWDPNDKAFLALLGACQRTQTMDVYVIAQCGPTVSK